MDATRSTRLIAVGAAALVVGIALAALAVRGASGASAAPAPDPTPAAAAVPDPVPAEPAPRIPEDLQVPDGHEAVALQLPYDASVAGLPGPGDRVNVYAVRADRETSDGDEGPRVEQVLTDVEVLAITGPDAEAGGGSPTVVVALTPGDVPDVVLVQASERVWLTLVPSTTAGA